MSDIGIEAQLVAEALEGSSFIGRRGAVIISFGDNKHLTSDFPLWQELVTLGLRLRKIEQDRDRWRKLALEEHEPDWLAGEAGPSGGMAAMPAQDHCTGGYGMASLTEHQKLVAGAHAMGVEAGRALERELITRDLRRVAKAYSQLEPGVLTQPMVVNLLLSLVACYERGEHRKPADEGQGDV
jgi:hypothetical protein